MEPGQHSGIVETFNAVSILKMVSKEAFNDSLYQADYNSMKEQMLNTENNRGYTNWLNDAKKAVSQEDYRSEVY